jgi:hypothetical protein
VLGLLAAWLLYPAVALLVCLGHGLLVERASGGRLPGALVLPAGMAGLICATQLTTYYDVTAEATLPLVIVLTLAGLALGRSRLRGAPVDRWAAAAGLGVFAVFAAPVVLTGHATFAGYTVLGDTSIHFIGADALLTYGRDLHSLAPSSYEYSLTAYYGANGYPSGGPTTAGALTSLVHQDVAWTFQPFLSLLAALMALALYSLAEPLIESRPLRAAAAFVAAQPALVLAYALQGSVKEVGTAFGVVTCFALLPVWARQAGDGARRVLALVVAASATVGIVGLAAGVWLGPLAVVAVVAALRGPARAGARRLAGAALLAAVVAAVLCYQALADLGTYVSVSGGVVTSQLEYGNLLGPLDPLSKFGVWLTGDYRVKPVGLWTENRVLLYVVWIAMAVGAFWVLRRRAWSVATFLVLSLAAHLYVVRTGSPWADGKALMIVSPALLLAATLAAGALHRRHALAGWVAVVAVGFGVLWSNALAYHDVSDAPHDRMQELRDAGERIAGHGPTLYPEFEEFAKHFLRPGDPEGPSEGWQRRFALSATRDGQFVRQGLSVDLDQMTDRYLAEYRTIVLRRGSASSRPPSGFRRVWTGRFYEIWERTPGSRAQLVEHHSMGAFREPTGIPECTEVRRLGGVAERSGGRLVYVERPANVIASPANAKLPRNWYVDPSDGSSVVTRGAGELTLDTPVPASGTYSLWLEGSFGRAVDVYVDGRRAGRVGGHLNGRGGAEHVAILTLAAGPHRVRIVRGGPSAAPGDGGLRLLGPVTLTAADPTGLPVRALPAARWRELCGRSVDWIEVVRG